VKSFARALPAVLLVCAALAVAQTAEVPYLTGRVVDNAEILSADTRKRLTEVMRQHEQKNGNQIAVLTVPTIHGESVEEYAVRVFDQWKFGEKGKDNGILVLVVPQDRRMRIEVGYGLEGIVTDAHASRIIRNVMTPRFRDGDYNGGITRGVDALIAQLEGRQAAPEREAPRAGKPAAEKSEFIKAPNMALHEKILFGAFIFGIIGLFTFMGIVTPGMGWFLYFFLIPFWAMFPVAIFGSGITFYILLAYLMGFPIAKLLVSRSDFYRRAAEELRKKGVARVGGFTVGGGSWGSRGSWSSSGGFSGGGFSGGGGSSGGGGASGSW
jgi:uncharacterized protein